MKKVLQIVLVVVIIGLAYLLADGIMAPLRFKKEVQEREAVVITRIKDIRAAEQAYKKNYGEYTGNFDTLIHFILNDSLTFIRSLGSADDSVAVASGEFQQEEFRVPVIDTIFSPRKLTPAEVRELPIIPFTDGKRFFLAAGEVTTESGIVVPVFEARAPYTFYLSDLDEQLLSNLVDEDVNTFMRYPGIKVGDLNAATNDALNRTE